MALKEVRKVSWRVEWFSGYSTRFLRARMALECWVLGILHLDTRNAIQTTVSGRDILT